MKDLDQTDFRIIKGLCEGKCAKEMNIGVPTKTVEYRISEMRRAFGCANTTQLISCLFIKGIAQEIINLEV